MVCRILAALFLVSAVVRLAVSFVPLANPLLSLPQAGCEECSFRRDPVTLLEPQLARKLAWQTPGSEQRIVEQLGKAEVRLMLFAANLARAIPFFLLFIALAMALRSFAAGGFNSGAVRWLRRSALASIGWAVAQPVSESIRQTAFSPVTHGQELTHLVLDLNSVLWPVLLSLAVWVCVWALEEAVAIQQDLEEYV